MRRGALASALLAGACVLPDREIVIVDEDVQNKHPVRFIEPTPVTNEAAEECLAVLEAAEKNLAVCQPSDPETVLPAFLDPEYFFEGDEGDVYPYRFCSCDQGKVDSNKLPAGTLYVEDRKDNVSESLQNLYAALQLDLKPSELSPQRTVQYTQFVNPTVPLAALPKDDIEYEPPRRPPTAAGRELRLVKLGFEDRRMDLCNDAGQPLTRGYHTLRVIVTDVPWFLPMDVDDENARQSGVPDIGNGATYDTLTYTFFCGRYQAAGPDDDPPEVDAYCNTQCGAPVESL